MGIYVKSSCSIYEQDELRGRRHPAPEYSHEALLPRSVQRIDQAGAQEAVAAMPLAQIRTAVEERNARIETPGHAIFVAVCLSNATTAPTASPGCSER
jgi:hypothetical protein